MRKISVPGWCLVLLAPALAVSCNAASAPPPDSAATCADNGEPLLHVPSPEWRDQIIYMLLIDRFNDGDPSNNDQGRGEYDPNRASHFSGGDLRGITDKVGYIKSLGATTVWISPPLANQWWSTPYQATGWHGYWPVHFQETDVHFGTLRDYRRLSHRLHCNGMYLIQDVIANHAGNFFAYDGTYDPSDTAKNFYLLEEHSHQPAPTQYPFNLVDRRNPEHAAADIYHWTPTIQDFTDRHQETHYSLGHVADLNSENPVVIHALKDAYKYWMDAVGVDGFRMDAVMLVPHEFWHRFLRDSDGIYAHANRLGKAHFLTFGEAFAVSAPFADNGERKIRGYLGSGDDLGANSMLGFPLYHEINQVLARGGATRLLAYRLRKFMELYPDPFIIPNFIDNHDTARFLATGHPRAFRQALALLFTIPGIPIIYQGTEQGLLETRQAMFAGGHRNAGGSFDPESPYYRYIQRLTRLRRAHPVLTRGDLRVLASEAAGPGVLAYRREYGGEVVVVLLNSAEHSVLLSGLDAGLPPGRRLEPLFAERFSQSLATDSRGLLSARLSPRAIVVLRPGEPVDANKMPVAALDIVIEGAANGKDESGGPPGFDDQLMRPGAVTGRDEPGRSPEVDDQLVRPGAATGKDDPGRPGSATADRPGVFTSDFILTGRVSQGGARLQLILDGNLDRARGFVADDDGRWQVPVPVRDLGEVAGYAQILAEDTNQLSARFNYITRVAEPELTAVVEDAPDDAYGPTGEYLIPQQRQSGRQREIESVSARAAGRNLEIRLKMAEITDSWLPPFGFDNLTVTTFFDLPDRRGATTLPLLNADMPPPLNWDLAHFARGWDSYTYRSAGSDANRQGEKLGVSPQVSAHKQERTITLFYQGSLLGVEDWAGAKIYLTTWATTGEGVYMDLRPQPSQWYFGGGEPGDPKIMDAVLLELGHGQ